jgi:hypothetical protein
LGGLGARIGRDFDEALDDVEVLGAASWGVMDVATNAS